MLNLVVRRETARLLKVKGGDDANVERVEKEAG
jgi:hypothetical protein